MSEADKEKSGKYFIRAQETLAEGKHLAEGKFWNGVPNRLYYACFYAAHAFLALEGIEPSSHKGVKLKFGELAIVSGKLSAEWGRTFSRLFALRHDTDYDAFSSITEEEALALVILAEDFINAVAGIN